MKEIYTVFVERYDKNDKPVGNIIEGMYDSEDKAIKAIQEGVKSIREFYEAHGKRIPLASYVIDHIPTEFEIMLDEIHYITIGEISHTYRYQKYNVE